MIIVCTKILQYLCFKSHGVVPYFHVKALFGYLVITKDGGVGYMVLFGTLVIQAKLHPKDGLKMTLYYYTKL